MAILAAFQPTYGAGISVTTSTSSSATLLDPNATKNGGGNKAVRVTNQDSTDGVYLRIGPGSGIVATSADFYLAPGQQCVLSKAEYDDYIAIIATANTPIVHATVGEGLCIS